MPLKLLFPKLTKNFFFSTSKSLFLVNFSHDFTPKFLSLKRTHTSQVSSESISLKIDPEWPLENKCIKDILKSDPSTKTSIQTQVCRRLHLNCYPWWTHLIYNSHKQVFLIFNFSFNLKYWFIYFKSTIYIFWHKDIVLVLKLSLIKSTNWINI